MTAVLRLEAGYLRSRVVSMLPQLVVAGVLLLLFGPAAPTSIGATPSNRSPIPVGLIVPFGGSTSAVPTGWMVADGRELSRAAYPDLYETIGTAFGAGDASTTFNLPDLRGRMPLGKTVSGLGSAVGEAGGVLDHGMESRSEGPHRHQFLSPGHSHSLNALQPHSQTYDGRATATTHNGCCYEMTYGTVVLQPVSSAPSNAWATVSLPAATEPVESSEASYGVSVGSANPPFLALNYVISVAPDAALPCGAMWASAANQRPVVAEAADAGAPSAALGACLDPAFTGLRPDLRGRFPLGKTVSGTGSALNGTGGALTHSHTATVAAHTHSATLSAHSHTVSEPGHQHSVTSPGDSQWDPAGNSGMNDGWLATSSGMLETSTSTAAAAGGGTFQTASGGGQTLTSSAATAPHLALDYVLTPLSLNGLEAGAVAPFAGSTSPAGWLVADGSSVSRAKYAALFDEIGERYGVGDGSTTFNLPNLTGRVALGRTGSGPASGLGDSGGSISHQHTFTISGHRPTLQVGIHNHTWSTFTPHSHNIYEGGSTAYTSGSSATHFHRYGTPAQSSSTSTPAPTSTASQSLDVLASATSPQVTVTTVARPTVPYLAVTYLISTGAVDQLAAQERPTGTTPIALGTVIPFAGSLSTVPTSGWLVADGRGLSRAAYPELFAAVGTVFGAGNGSTTFNLPDLRGRMPLGKATTGPGSTLGESGGSLDHGVESTSVAPHRHTFGVPAHTHSMNALQAHSHTYADRQTTTTNNGQWYEMGYGTVVLEPISSAPSNGWSSVSGAAVTVESSEASHQLSVSAANPPFRVIDYLIAVSPNAALPCGGMWASASGQNPPLSESANGQTPSGTLAPCLDDAFAGLKPELRGRFALGKSAAGTGSTINSAGGTLNHTHAATDTHTHTASLVSHTHIATEPAHQHAVTSPPATPWDPAGTAGMNDGWLESSSAAIETPTSTALAAGGGAFQTTSAGTATVSSSSANGPYLALEFLASPLNLTGFEPGAVTAFAGAAPPAGWLVADGSAVSRTQYSALFAEIGVTYGVGDGTTTFTLPDLSGRAVLGRSASGTGSTLGAAGGTLMHQHTLTVSGHRPTLLVGSHNHTWSPFTAHSHYLYEGGSTAYTSGSSQTHFYRNGSPAQSSATSTPAPSSTASQNLDTLATEISPDVSATTTAVPSVPYLTLNYLISTGTAPEAPVASTVRSNGASITWSKYTPPAGRTFDRYEVHRSSTENFTPSATTLLTTIRDLAVTAYTDTTAAPDQSFSYTVTANGVRSEELRLTTPLDGHARKLLQPSPRTGTTTTISSLSINGTRCLNYGSDAELLAGAAADGTRRGLLAFDLRDIPVGATVLSAQLSLWRKNTPSAQTRVDVHPATAEWSEGVGVQECTGDGATWDDARSGVSWTQAGGDFDPTTVASSTIAAAAVPGWLDWDVKPLVAAWLAGDKPNLGFAVKTQGEVSGDLIRFVSDDDPQARDSRPKLVVEYIDGSKAVAPSVSIQSPTPNATVRNALTATIAAADDRRVESVELLVDGSATGSDNTPPFEIAWDTNAVANGSHTVAARATDDAGNVATSDAVSVSVDNSAPPSVSPVVIGAYRDEVLHDTPTGYWRLDESAGSTVSDASGNGRDGTYAGGPALGQSPLISGPLPGTAATFNGVPATASVPDNAALDIGTGSATWEVLLRTTAATGAFLTKADAGNANGVSLTLDQGALRAQVHTAAGGVVLSTVGRVDDGQTHHLTVVLDRAGGQLRAYADGTLIGSTSAASVAGLDLNAAAALQISPTSAGLSGTFDELAFYPRSLTAAEISRHYAARVDRPVGGTRTISAAASDDVAVTRVEFLVDGEQIAEDASAPYVIDWDTLDPATGAYDGDHLITAKVYDSGDQMAESSPVSVVVANTAQTAYKADFSATGVPAALTYDPATNPQATVPVDVTVTNGSAGAWTGSATTLGYRWFDGSGAVSEGAQVALGTDLGAGASRTLRLNVQPPSVPEGTARALYTLRFDLNEGGSGPWFASKGNKPFDGSVLVTKVLAVGLGLERYYHYSGEELGAAAQQLVNVATGNSLVRWSPFEAPGRGLSTVVDLTYNSLEGASNSPVGNGFSLSISSLTRLGSRLAIGSNAIELIDGDGTTHRFTSPDGQAWHAPAGVYLYLRLYSTTDATRRWALTRPDRVTFFFDADGNPTSVEDANGNRLTFELESLSDGSKRVGRVLDAAGRAFTLSYYAAAETPYEPVVGRMRQIRDHSGSPLDFDYYADGNLLRITQRGGANADGSFLADRGVTFTYTSSSGGPAISDPGARADPDPATSDQTTRLYSVRDPRGAETTFVYFANGKLASRTDRAGRTTDYTYDPVARTATVNAPLSRSSTYSYDAEGKVTTITNPLAQQLTLDWTPNRNVRKVTQPTGRFTEYAYNDNGYPIDVWDELRNHTLLEYEHLAVDGNDTSARWEPGRTIPHSSQLLRKTSPKGTATVSPTTDFQWQFSYDTKGNLTSARDPAGFSTTYAYNANGTLGSATDANNQTTTFVAYEDSGLATELRDAKNRTTRLGYDVDGNLLWLQDPLHATSVGTDVRAYRTHFNYDSFGRLGRQSAPKSTNQARGLLLWSDVEYDPNDNAVASIAPYYGAEGTKSGARTTTTYNPIDQPSLITGPDTSADPAGERTQYLFDDAGRLAQVVAPKGVLTTGIADDFSVSYSYDALDRVSKETGYEFDASGSLVRTLNTHSCYDVAGDLLRVTAPKAALAAVDCAATPPSYTTRYVYDDAHRLIRQLDPLGFEQSVTYDANGNVQTSTDQAGSTTIRTYDQRDLLAKLVVPFDTGRLLTTKYEYDPVGNLKRLISPRAWDVSADKTTFTDYVTEYQYDVLNRLARTDLPTATGFSRAYIHNAYDANSNLAWTSLPVSASDPNDVDTLQTTIVEYWDTGWIAASKESATSRVHFDYTAEGWQSSRTPETDTGELDPARQMLWSYYPDGPVKEAKDLGGQGSSYGYDANGNLLSASEASGLTTAGQAPVDIGLAYDSLDRLAKVTQQKTGATTNLVSTYAYDLNANLVERIENAEETLTGAPVAAGRRHTLAYDARDLVSSEIDYGFGAGATDDEQIEHAYANTGSQIRRELSRGGPGAWALEQKVERTHYQNGLLRTLSTRNGGGSTLEHHDLFYETLAGIYLDGQKTRDLFTLVGPDTNAPCRTTACAESYEYDPMLRLTREIDGHGTESAYTVDLAGNVTNEVVTEDGVARTRTSSYIGQQLRTQTENGATKKFFYTPEGALSCITTATGTSIADCLVSTGAAPSPSLLEAYSYDYRGRLASSHSYGGGTAATDATSYRYDALGRPAEQTDQQGAASPKTTLFEYLGLSDQVSKESTKVAGSIIGTKSFSFDAFGRRLALTDAPTAGPTTRYALGQDPHGSVSLLIEQGGAVKAAYGYTPYGAADDELSAGDAATDPLNSYRFSGKRFDVGSGTINMGARHFSPSTGRFLQLDTYSGATRNLGLSRSPLTGNRYSLAGGNPIGYAESDGHRPSLVDGASVSYWKWLADQESDAGTGAGQPDVPLTGGAGGGSMQPELEHVIQAAVPGDLTAGLDNAFTDFLATGQTGWRSLAGRDTDYCSKSTLLRSGSYNAFRRCYIGAKASDNAILVTKLLVAQGSLKDRHNSDQSNAFKHAYWSALMSFAMGRNNAQFITDLHEATTAAARILNVDEQRQRSMDLHNNAVGRVASLEAEASGLSGRSATISVMFGLIDAASLGVSVAGSYLWQLTGPGGLLTRTGSE